MDDTYPYLKHEFWNSITKSLRGKVLRSIDYTLSDDGKGIVMMFEDGTKLTILLDWIQEVNLTDIK